MTMTINDFVSNNVICGVSALYSDILTLAQAADSATLRATSLDLDDLQALGSRPDYEAAAEEHIRGLDRGELVEALEERDIEDERPEEEIAAGKAQAPAAALAALQSGRGRRSWTAEDVDGTEPEFSWPGLPNDVLRATLRGHLDEQADGFKDYVEGLNIDYDYIEAYEHWAVTDWLAGKLREHGEIVGDLGNLVVWGRTTTGQAISMDGVIEAIYAEVAAS